MAGPALPEPLDFRNGEVQLGPYRLLRPISAGGMARVYEGRLDSLAGVTTRVAVKVIHPDFANEAAFQELFITEARISARLEHQNLVRIQQFNREGHLYYLVMEYIDGVTFRKIISMCRRHGLQLPVQVIAELGRQVCEGLYYAHTLATETGDPLHLVHRDVKPSNLMLNGHGVAKVLDFGISSAHGQIDTAGAVKGTWGYMALEQAEGAAVGPAADVFGLGAVLYELATLEPLFGEKDNGLIRQRLFEDAAAARAAALGGQYADLGGVLVRALQRDPEARHRSAAVFGRALSSLVVDPVGANDLLIRLYRDMRALEGPAAPAAQAASPEKPRSMPTMSRAGIGSPRIEPPPALPVRFGDEHGAGPPPRLPGKAKPPSRLGPTLAAAGLLLVAIGVLAFAAWQLFFGGPRPAEAALSAPVGAEQAAAAAAELAGGGGAAAEAGGASSAGPQPAVGAGGAVGDGAVAPPGPGVPGGGSVIGNDAPGTGGAAAGTGASAAGTGGSAAAPPTATAAPEAPRAASTASTARGGASGARTRTEPTTSAPESESPVRIAPESSTPATTPSPSTGTTAVTEAAVAPEVKRTGLLSISSLPRAQVMIDGKYVRYTPLFQHSVSAGTHSVLLVAEDGRRKSFKVDVAPDAETRKIWNFDEEKWSEP